MGDAHFISCGDLFHESGTCTSWEYQCVAGDIAGERSHINKGKGGRSGIDIKDTIYLK